MFLLMKEANRLIKNQKKITSVALLSWVGWVFIFFGSLSVSEGRHLRFFLVGRAAVSWSLGHSSGGSFSLDSSNDSGFMVAIVEVAGVTLLIVGKECFTESNGIHFDTFDSVSELLVTDSCFFKDFFHVLDLLLEHSGVVGLDFGFSVFDDLLPLQCSNNSLQMLVDNQTLNELLLQ